MRNRLPKNLFGKILLIVFFVMLVLSLFFNPYITRARQHDPISPGIEKLRAGVTSQPLYFGKEQIIHFGKPDERHIGAHIYITEEGEPDDHGLYHVGGNIDFMVFYPAHRQFFPSKSAPDELSDEMYVALRTEFALTYQKDGGQRRVLDYTVRGLPGSDAVYIHEQDFQSDVRPQSNLSLGQPLSGSLHIFFSDMRQGFPADCTWRCALTLQERSSAEKNEAFLITLSLTAPPQEEVSP